MVGVCGPPVGEWQVRGRGGGSVGGCGARFACVVSVYVSACGGVPVWSPVGRAVWRGSLPSSAAAARISQMSVRIWCTAWSVVGRGYCSDWLRSMRRRTLRMGWYPQVRECCGLAGGVLPCVGARLDLCVGGGDGPDPGHGPCGRPAALDPLGQAAHGQSQVVARPPGGDLSQGTGRRFVPRLDDAPEDFLRGGGVLYCPWWGGPWGKHGVGPFDDPLWARGRCCGSHYVVVLALEDYTPYLRQGVVPVCRWGGEVVVGGAEAGGAEGGIAGWCGCLFPLFRMVRVCWVVLRCWGWS